MRSNVRSLVALALAVAVLVYPATVLAQESTGSMSEGVVAGQMDGKSNTSGFLWFGAGCVFNWLGVAAAYLIIPNPPATRLLGKSSEYVAAYTDAYREAAKSVQTKNAWTGCVVNACVGGVVGVIYWVAVLAAMGAQ